MVEDGIAQDVIVTGALSTVGADISIQVSAFSGDVENIYIPLWKET
jgi:hypothetical protein